MKNKLILYSDSALETMAIAGKIASHLNPGTVIALTGELGAGKTAFIRGIAKQLGISEPVTSPSFTLLNEYEGRDYTLYHFDFYRLEEDYELDQIGFNDALESSGIIAVEWADKFLDYMPERRIDIAFETTGENQRRITIISEDSFDLTGN